MGNMNKKKQDEIERRFAPKSIPEEILQGIADSKYRALLIHQGYVAGNSGNRLRDEMELGQHRYYLTQKKGTGVKRTEKEEGISRRQFTNRWGAVVDQLWKQRYLIPYGEYVIELNFFLGRLKGYVQAEVEFDSEAAAAAFTPPAWFSPEVTDDERHNNFNLARYGVPTEET